MKPNEKEELQSRRQFFKKAAKGVLPILGAVALANMPVLASVTMHNSIKLFCQHVYTYNIIDTSVSSVVSNSPNL